MKILLPIAGRGSRFKKEAQSNAEFLKPKPLIPVRGYPMVRWATGSLPFVQHRGQSRPNTSIVVDDKDIVFVILEEHNRDYDLISRLKEIYGDDITIVSVPEVTRGAAETCLMAREYIDVDEPLLVSDSDHYIDGAVLLEGIKRYPNIGGIIPLFHVPDKNPKWSFSRLNKEGNIVETAEKDPISEWANIGAYYFGRGKDFVHVATEAMEKKDLVNGEYYIAPLYNKLIQQGKKIMPVFPKYVYGLGTPSDLTNFLEYTTYSLN